MRCVTSVLVAGLPTLAILAACGARTDVSEVSEVLPADASVVDAGVDVGDAPPSNACTAGECDGSVVLFGGCALGFGGCSTPLLNDTWTFDGTNWTQVTVATSPPVREFASMATLGSQAVLFGGWTSGGLMLNDTWIFGGSTWTEMTFDSAPPPRATAGMAPLDGKVVLFGGFVSSDAAATLLGDTWMFDGTSWTQLAESNSPSARWTPTMAALGSKVVLFGGCSDSVCPYPLSDTWILDETGWTQVMVASSPPGRWSGSMASMGDRVVLFGGYTELTQKNGEALVTTFDDTWTFDGTSWTQAVAGSSPSARTASMATLGSEAMLFGGSYAASLSDGGLTSAFFDDTWTFDGTRWTQVTLASSPPGRYLASMAFVP
jgi:hypothetical protein